MDEDDLPTVEDLLLARYHRLPEEIREVFASAQQLELADFAQFAPEREEVMRRVIRAVLTARGVVHAHHPMQVEMLTAEEKNPRKPADDLRLFYGCQLVPKGGVRETRHDLALMRALKTWCIKLGIQKGSTKQPDLGQKGMRNLFLDLEHFRGLMPTPERIVEREMELIEEVAKLLAFHGAAKTRGWLRSFMGLSNLEAGHAMTLSKAWTVALHSSSVEENLAMMTRRLEGIAERARKAMDLKTEIQAMKYLGQIQGLTQVSEDERAKSLIKLLQNNPLPEISDSPANTALPDRDSR